MRMPPRWRAAAALAALTVVLLAAGRASRPAGDPRIYDSPDVTPAPPAPLQSGNASFRFEDARGMYERRAGFASAPPGSNVEPPYVNILFTHAGHLRSGDVHACEQLNHVVFGALTLTQRLRGRDVVSRHVGGDVIRIPPHVPHLYSFDADTLMTEAWRTPSGAPCAFRAWLYAPYRARIPAASAEKRFSVDNGG